MIKDFNAQIALEVIIAVTVMVMFVAFMAQFIRWEMRDVNKRIDAYRRARTRMIRGSQLKSISVNVYEGSSLYSFYKEH